MRSGDESECHDVRVRFRGRYRADRPSPPQYHASEILDFRKDRSRGRRKGERKSSCRGPLFVTDGLRGRKLNWRDRQNSEGPSRLAGHCQKPRDKLLRYPNNTRTLIFHYTSLMRPKYSIANSFARSSRVWHQETKSTRLQRSSAHRKGKSSRPARRSFGRFHFITRVIARLPEVSAREPVSMRRPGLTRGHQSTR